MHSEPQTESLFDLLPTTDTSSGAEGDHGPSDSTRPIGEAAKPTIDPAGGSANLDDFRADAGDGGDEVASTAAMPNQAGRHVDASQAKQKQPVRAGRGRVETASAELGGADAADGGATDLAVLTPPSPSVPGVPSETTTPLRATVGDIRLVALDSVSIAPDNLWGSDVVKDEHFRRLTALVADPATMEPLLVVSAGNGWSIVGDPASYLALRGTPAATDTTQVPVREVTGSKAAILFHVGSAALATRPFRHMRRARLALALCEVDGLAGSTIAARLKLAGSGVSRDIKAARMERDHPSFAALLANPSESPVKFYLDLQDHADRQSAPGKAMTALAAAAAKLARSGSRLTPTAAKIALGVIARQTKDGSASSRRDLGAVAGAEAVAIERSADGSLLRLIMTFAAAAGPLEAEAGRYAAWLSTLGPLPLEVEKSA